MEVVQEKVEKVNLQNLNIEVMVESASDVNLTEKDAEMEVVKVMDREALKKMDRETREEIHLEKRVHKFYKMQKSALKKMDRETRRENNNEKRVHQFYKKRESGHYQTSGKRLSKKKASRNKLVISDYYQFLIKEKNNK